jgi:hypothetical protein
LKSPGTTEIDVNVGDWTGETSTAWGDERLIAKVAVPVKSAVIECTRAGTIARIVAVPFATIWALPIAVTCEQGFAPASQNSTCPGETGLPPEVTVAVRVMTPPDETDEGEAARTVEVPAGVAPYTGLVKKEKGSVANIKKRKRRRKALMGEATCASNNRGSGLRDEL